MTPKTKLEILGPYTPEHEGPFCTRYGLRLLIPGKINGSLEYPVIAWLDEYDYSVMVFPRLDDVMCAREVLPGESA